MSADKNQATGKVYQLKVSLRDISPMIWRRLLVTSDTNMAHLHAILQVAMGWEDVHLHRFRIHGKDYGISRAGGLLFSDDQHQIRLSDFRLRAGERFVYEYDMGGCRHHDIRLERALPLDPENTYPVCMNGAREDVVLVAQRLLEFYDGGPCPTTGEREFMAAMERMHDRLENAPIAFDRRATNVALSELRKETICTSASR